MKKSKFIFLFLFLIFSIQKINYAQTNDWQIPISIEIENKEFTLIFGVNQNATENFDVGIDSLAPPAAFSPYACFWICDFPNSVSRDIRGLDSLITWELRIFNAEGKKSKILWQTDSIQLTSTITMNDSINLFQKNLVEFVGDQEIKITYKKNPSAVQFRSSQKVVKNFQIINYPNPFSTITNFEIRNNKNFPITATIYNVLGQHIQNFSFDSINKNFKFQWDGLDLFGYPVPAGIYFLKIETQKRYNIKKLYKID